MIRILFVDDEVLILDALRRLLRRQSARWDVAFASSGAEALQLLRARPFDVVITDMRMPGMDGAQLLEQVRRESPQTVRLVLSGFADQASVMRCVPVAHQFLGKPFDAAVLARVIERATAFQARVSDHGVRAMIAGLDKIPSPPRSYWQITHTLADPAAGLDQVARLVEEDPGVSAKLLQLVNSAYFGLAQHVTSVRRAVTFLGAELLRSLVFACHVIGALEKLPWASAEVRAGFERVQLGARLSARLAQRIRGDGNNGQEAFAGGLFHDLGKLVGAAGRPEQFEEVLRGPQGPSVLEQERALFGFSHPEAGAYLLGLWGLPNGIVEAVEHHHQPSAIEGDKLGAVGAVHLAAVLADEALGAAGPQVETVLDAAWLEKLGLSDQLPRWREWAAEELRGLGPVA